MSIVITPAVTDAAKARIASKSKLRLRHIRVGDGNTQVVQKIYSAFKARFPLNARDSNGAIIKVDGLHIVSQDDGNSDYIVRHIDLLLADGSTFASADIDITSTSLYKRAGITLSLPFDVVLPADALAALLIDNETLLPPSRSAVESNVEAATARVGNLPVRIQDSWNADSCPNDMLPWLAWAMSVDNWNFSWTAAQKRAVIKQSAFIHRQKGTVGAVRNALKAFGLTIELQEWFEAGNEPHTFLLIAPAQGARLANGETGLTSNFYKALYSIIDNTKPARSHYELRVTAYFEKNTLSTAAITQRVALLYRPAETKRAVTLLTTAFVTTTVLQPTVYIHRNLEASS